MNLIELERALRQLRLGGMASVCGSKVMMSPLGKSSFVVCRRRVSNYFALTGKFSPRVKSFDPVTERLPVGSRKR